MRNKFEQLVDRTRKNYNIGLSKNIKTCAVLAIDIEIGNKEFVKMASLFGITKSEFADKIVTVVQGGEL